MTGLAVALFLLAAFCTLGSWDWLTSHRQHRREAAHDRATANLFADMKNGTDRC